MGASDKKVVIVTGAARGIGAATAIRLAHEGWQPVLADIDGAALETVTKPANALSIVCDVGVEADIQRLVETSRQQFGRIDAIVSKAVIASPRSLSQL